MGAIMVCNTNLLNFHLGKSSCACTADGAPPAKRHKESHQEAAKVVVLDIEGTVAPISFVYDVMFPYFTKHLEAYLDKTWETAQTQAEVAELFKQVWTSCNGQLLP